MLEKDLEKAREIFSFQDTITIEELKRKYRELVLNYHPDIVKTNEYEGFIKEINHYYKVLMYYCMNYPIRININQVEDIDYEDWWKNQFVNYRRKK